MIEAFLAAFLAVAPPASPAEVVANKCTETSIRPGCSTNFRGGSTRSNRSDGAKNAADRANAAAARNGRGGKGKK